MKKHTLWSPEINSEFVQAYADDEEISYGEAYEILVDENADGLDILRYEMDNGIIMENAIIVIADLGLWDGRKDAYKIVQNLSDCFYSSWDADWYVDSKGELRAEVNHHDGTNYYLYRELKPDLTDKQKQNFFRAICAGKATPRMISYYTNNIGKRIAEYYGWCD